VILHTKRRRWHGNHANDLRPRLGQSGPYLNPKKTRLARTLLDLVNLNVLHNIGVLTA
jgi:hypothetical protein